MYNNSRGANITDGSVCMYVHINIQRMGKYNGSKCSFLSFPYIFLLSQKQQNVRNQLYMSYVECSVVVSVLIFKQTVGSIVSAKKCPASPGDVMVVNTKALLVREKSSNN
jgi:hypothetical protein